jgi:putative nucleotidyltransferase with HDIG domain
MFSSVRAGVAGLDTDLDAFFVLPVDCPLVTPRVLRMLADHFGRCHQGIIYPVCCGRRGHPPLLSMRYSASLLQADNRDNLQTFLSAFPNDEADLDVRDLTVVMDMDTPEEHRLLERFAGILDGTGTGPTGGEPSLTADEALFILAVTGTPPNVVEHCRAVAAVGETLAKALETRLPALDVALVRAGCLLHDLARLQHDHARLAQELLANFGLPRLGAVVGQHMVIAPHFPRTPGVTEAELVYLADKLVADDEAVGLDQREARALRKVRAGSDAAGRIRARMDDARTIAGKAAAVLGRPIEVVLAEIPREKPHASGGAAPDDGPHGDGPPRLKIFLVRHAEPVGPDGKRFLGQGDPVLAARGEEQAKGLADKLTAMTGGACFDAVYSSDLQRSVRTAEIVAERCGIAVQREPWLREIDVGLWEGLTWEEARQAYPAEHGEREQDVVGRPFPHGESFEDLQARVIPGLRGLIGRSLAAGHRRVLVVGHKGVNRVILAHILGLPLADLFSIEQDFCAVTVLEVPAYSTAPAISKPSTSM